MSYILFRVVATKRIGTEWRFSEKNEFRKISINFFVVCKSFQFYNCDHFFRKNPRGSTLVPPAMFRDLYPLCVFPILLLLLVSILLCKFSFWLIRNWNAPSAAMFDTFHFLARNCQATALIQSATNVLACQPLRNENCSL